MPPTRARRALRPPVPIRRRKRHRSRSGTLRPRDRAHSWTCGRPGGWQWLAQKISSVGSVPGGCASAGRCAEPLSVILSWSSYPDRSEADARPGLSGKVACAYRAKALAWRWRVHHTASRSLATATVRDPPLPQRVTPVVGKLARAAVPRRSRRAGPGNRARYPAWPRTRVLPHSRPGGAGRRFPGRPGRAGPDGRSLL